MSWEPTSVGRSDWGHLQIVVDGVDVTFFRDIPTQVGGWSNGEPFGDSTASIRFPQITPFEAPGQGSLSWMKDWADVDIYRVRPNGTTKILWEGLLTSVEDSQTESEPSFEITCMGAMFQLDRYVRAPLHLGKEASVTDLFDSQFSHQSRPALRMDELQIVGDPRADPADPDTMFKTKRTGSWNRVLTGYLQDELALMITKEDFPRQWTIHLDRNRRPVMRLKEYNAIDYTIAVGSPGVSHRLTRDQTQSSNVIYGEGTDQAGTIWRNSRRTPTINVYDPLASDPRVHTGRDIDGNPITPELRDDSVMRSEIHYGYGAGVDLNKGIQSAEAQLRRDIDAGYMGTITLRADPLEASRFEMLAKQQILYKHFRPAPYDLGIKRFENSQHIIDMNNRVYDATTQAYLGMLFHISGVQVAFDTLTVTITVDTKARDLLSLAELLSRTNEGHLDPAKRLRLGQSDVVDDTKQKWDYYSGSGYIPAASVHGDGKLDGSPSPASAPDHYVYVSGGWKVFPIRSADKASIMRTEVRAFNTDGTLAAVPFHVSVYEHSKVVSDMPANPFEKGIWTPSLTNTLAGPPEGIVVGWGVFGQRAGFWPGLDSESDPVSGVFIDEGTWQFELNASLIEPGLWVAIYCAGGAYFQGRLFQGVE